MKAVMYVRTEQLQRTGISDTEEQLCTSSVDLFKLCRQMFHRIEKGKAPVERNNFNSGLSWRRSKLPAECSKDLGLRRCGDSGNIRKRTARSATGPPGAGPTRTPGPFADSSESLPVLLVYGQFKFPLFNYIFLI